MGCGFVENRRSAYRGPRSTNKILNFVQPVALDSETRVYLPHELAVTVPEPVSICVAGDASLALNASRTA